MTDSDVIFIALMFLSGGMAWLYHRIEQLEKQKTMVIMEVTEDMAKRIIENREKEGEDGDNL